MTPSLEDIVVCCECSECNGSFLTSRYKNIGEIVPCNLCGFKHIADDDDGVDGEMIWFLVPAKDQSLPTHNESLKKIIDEAPSKLTVLKDTKNRRQVVSHYSQANCCYYAVSDDDKWYQLINETNELVECTPPSDVELLSGIQNEHKTLTLLTSILEYANISNSDNT